jgi:hypothetical protein
MKQQLAEITLPAAGVLSLFFLTQESELKRHSQIPRPVE